jgi:hypothetical protein
MIPISAGFPILTKQLVSIIARKSRGVSDEPPGLSSLFAALIRA